MRDFTQHYRLYGLDALGETKTSEWIQAETDGDAVAFVRLMKKRLKCELWQQDRLVAEIEAFEGALSD